MKLIESELYAALKVLQEFQWLKPKFYHQTQSSYSGAEWHCDCLQKIQISIGEVTDLIVLSSSTAIRSNMRIEQNSACLTLIIWVKVGAVMKTPLL